MNIHVCPACTFIKVFGRNHFISQSTGGYVDSDSDSKGRQFERRNNSDYDYKMNELESPKGHYENHSVLIFIPAIQKELNEDIIKS